VSRIDDLRRLPDAEEVYLDALLPRVFDEVRGLIENVLRDYRAIKMIHESNELVKSDEDHAVALNVISPTLFRELTLDRLLLEEDIVRYQMLSRMVSTSKRWRINGDLSGEAAVQLIRQLCAEKEPVRRGIVKRVKSDPFYGGLYRRAVEELGLGDRAVAIAVLPVKLPLHLNMNKLKVYLGFTPEAEKTGRYNHELRGWLARSAAIICLKRTYNRKAVYKMELIMLKTLKRIHREIQREGEPAGP